MRQIKLGSYGFKYKGEHQERIVGLQALGYEVQTTATYCWEGLSRKEDGKVIFQYTLSGEGAIRIGDEIHPLKKGQAFLVKIPSDHTYYLPAHSEKWEFIYFTIYGKEAAYFYEKFLGKAGNVTTIPHEAKPIQFIYRMLERMQTMGMEDSYQTSSYAYSFMMECLHYLEYGHKNEDSWPVSIKRAVRYMNDNYQNSLSLEDIVAISGVSKYHFTRLFKGTVGETPMQFLTKIRMHHAIAYMKDKELTIEEIAGLVGFSNGNYFSKVFKQMLDVSPSVYRSSENIMPVDHFFLN